jgi:hypothetical protein
MKYLRMVELSSPAESFAARQVRLDDQVVDGVLLSAGLAVLLAASEETAGAEVPPEPELPPRKSVTYQPVPFNWKPAAVNCFLKLGCLHSGQSVKGASDIFCNTSLAKPQAWQR